MQRRNLLIFRLQTLPKPPYQLTPSPSAFKPFMATKETDKTPKTRSKKSCLPTCFGFPRSGRSSSGGRDIVSGGTRKRYSLSWPRFWGRKPDMRTVPVDVAVAEKMTCGRGEIEEEIQDIYESEAPGRNPAVVDVSLLNQGAAEKGRKAKNGNERAQSDAGNLNPDSRKDPDNSTFAKSDRIRPASPQTNPVHAAVTLSSSFTNRRKPAHPARISRLSGRNPAARNFDSMAGMSVLVVALAIMVVWGRFCAIVCTSAWFYFIPRLRTEAKSGDSASISRRAHFSTPDMDSEQYKKKVILEGLLERNHRSPAVIL
ncbi:hypothetical protein AAC387_Pa01g0463 [Persea americana]